MDYTRQTKNDLEQAKQIVEQHLALDTCVITLNEKCARPTAGVVTLSGGTEQDYPNVLEISRGLINVNQVQTILKTPLPPEILEHIRHMKCNCMMGIFQEINRAWLTVDSDIYIWAFDKSNDVRYFSASSEAILAVGLVEPCANVFTSCIQYLLILSTITETIFIGVASDNDDNKNNRELTLISEPIFTISNENVVTNVIKTTTSGRVFLGGKDGNLYEIVYKSDNSWFGRRFKRINHHSSKLSFLIPSILTSMVEIDPIVSISIDERRNILYCLTQNSCIEVFDLGEKGDEMKSVAKLSHAQISRCARSVLPVINESLYQHIIEIIPVSQEECNVYHMVAVTGSGVRLYFTTGFERGRPFKLQMMHIRLPPGYSPRSPHSRPSDVHTALYKKGNYLILTTESTEKDSLWCLSVDNFPFHNQLIETVTKLPLDGPTWAAAELKHSEDNMSVLKDPMIASAPLVVSQHLQSPRRWVILSPRGCHIVSLLRPVDILKQLLINNQGAANEAVKYYFESQPDSQACATCLVLACLESQSSPQIMEWAAQAFFLYGGFPQKIQCPPTDVATPNVPIQPRYENAFAPYVVSTPMHSPEFQMSSPRRFQPSSPQNSGLITPRNTANFMYSDNRKPGQTSMIQFSTKHIGLNLYFSRILRPLWNRNCVQRVSTDSGKDNLLSVLTQEDCEVILHHLYTLGLFLNKHMSITGLKKTSGLPVFQENNSNFGAENLDPYMQEKLQLETMLKFLTHVCEVLNLWKILIEHRFHLIAAEIPEDMQAHLAEFAFKDLFVLGYGVCVAMIISLINSYLTNNADVENISTRLRKLCPTLYRSEDAACSKANEILLKIIADNKKIKREIHPDDRSDMIQLALDLCKKVVPDICLHAVCPQFAAAEGYYALVHLCSAAAKALDPNNTALAHYKNREPQEDIQGSQMLSERMKMYHEIILALDQLVQFVDNPSNTTPELFPNASKHIEHIIKLVLQNEDELLHISVYEWMLNQDMLGEIIPHASPSLASYLESVLSRKPEHIQVCELLYKYYEMHGEHVTAAKLLYNLATSEKINLTLSERVRYMGRAVMSLRNNKNSFTTQNGLFMRDIEDKIEIAAIQQKVIDNIHLMTSQIQDVDNVLALLNKHLFDVSQLYQEFADPLDLHEAKLALLRCSDHNDPKLIESVWTNIIDQKLQQAEDAPTEYRMQKVLINVKPLVTQYRSSPYCLPLVFITRKLEILSCRTGADCSQVSKTLLQSGITLENLYETYNHILHSNDRCWTHEGNELYFLQACAQVVERFIDQKNSLSYKTRIKLTTALQDFVSSCINTAMSISATESQNIVQNFRSLQSQLSR